MRIVLGLLAPLALLVLLVIGTAPAQAAPGACCLFTGGCVIMESADCVEPSLYRGDGTTCDAEDVCPPLGACCVSATECHEWILNACVANNGVYKGDGTLCADVDCSEPTPREETRWGRIKSRYR